MNCSCFFHSSSPMSLNISVQCRFRLTVSAVQRRHLRRRGVKDSSKPNLTPKPTLYPAIFKLSDDSLQITLKSPSNSIQQLETRLNQLLDYGREAFDDLRTIVTVDGNNRGIVISCKRSTVEVLIALLVSSFVLVIAFRGLFKNQKTGGEVLVYKRDRSLGGKEVVVGKREGISSTTRKSTPLSSHDDNYYQKRTKTTVRRKGMTQLPQWWPQLVNSYPIETSNREEYQRIVNILIQEIMDRKMIGKDISTNDIIQLRHICKTYGVRAVISTENARDSLYRVSVNFVLDYCESISNVSTSIQINGEDPREFVSGLANNLGLETSHAARMVSAAVAARTRSRILQAWALEVQNKHSEALAELFKVCFIHQIFPPEENSVYSFDDLQVAPQVPHSFIQCLSQSSPKKIIIYEHIPNLLF